MVTQRPFEELNLWQRIFADHWEGFAAGYEKSHGEAVLYELKPGLDEKLYENALACLPKPLRRRQVIELGVRGMQVEQQKRYDVRYKDRLLGTLIPDLIVNATVIVDTKVVTAFNETHVAQTLGYLSIIGLDLALLLNFKNARLGVRRVVK